MTLELNHIVVGNFIWYNGETSTFVWDCPAMIHKVDHEKQVFWVTSLDDLAEQRTPYEFVIGKHSCDSRINMRPITGAEARQYLEGRLSRHADWVKKQEEEIERQQKKLEEIKQQGPGIERFIEKTKLV